MSPMPVITAVDLSPMRAIPPGMGGVRYGVTPCLSVREDDGRRHTKRLGGCYGHTKEEAEAKGRKAVSDWKQACGWAYGWTYRGVRPRPALAAASVLLGPAGEERLHRSLVRVSAGALALERR